MPSATPTPGPGETFDDPLGLLETGGRPDDLEPALREAADRVVEHLAVLRGGGPFLSSLDARLLVGWLEEGVPAALLCVALERVAERRRSRRVKSPLGLRACREEVRRLRARGLPGMAREPAPSVPPGADAESPASTHAPDASGLEARALAALAALAARPEGDPAARADAAMDIVRAFHAAAWEAAADEHAALRADAARDLAPFREAMDPAEWEASVEAGARDLLRRRFPRLSAAAVWDRLHAP